MAYKITIVTTKTRDYFYPKTRYVALVKNTDTGFLVAQTGKCNTSEAARRAAERAITKLEGC